MKLQTKLIVLVVTLIVIPLLILSWITYTQLRDISSARVFRGIDTLLNQTQQDLESMLQTVQANLVLFANSPLLRKYMLTSSEEERYRLMQLPLLELFSGYQQAYPDYYEIRVLLPDGYEDARMTRGDIPNITEEEADKHYFQELRDSPSDHYFSFFTNPDTQSMALLVAKKLYLTDPSIDPILAEPTLRGYLAITVSLDFLERQVQEVHLISGDHIFLTDNKGQIILHPEDQHSSLPPPLFKRLDQAADTGQVIDALYEGEITYFRGRRLHPQLLLFASVPQTQLLAASRGLGKLVATITVTAIIITVSLMLVMLKYLVADPIHRLRQATREIARGNLQAAIAFNSRDEIGELGQDFEQMRQSLYYSQQEVKAYQQSLQEKAIAAEAASRAKSTFLATMSHEIRTPLNGIIGPLELLLTTPLDQKQRIYTEMMSHSTQSLLSIINNILDFSKIEAGKMVLENIDFDLREVVEEVSELMAEPAQKKGLELICLITQQVPTMLNGDPARLRQMLLNLLGNAVKFTEHGEIAVRVEVAATTTDHTILRFQVRDTGIGIMPEALASIFTSFSQADGSTTRKYGGTGLGLSITQQLAELMGGETGVWSQPEKGSIFWFSARFTTVFPQPQPRALLPNRRALIIDNSAARREVLRYHLNTWSIAVDEAESSIQALSHLKRAANQGRPYDLAILDQHILDIDKSALVRLIKITAPSIRLIMTHSIYALAEPDEHAPILAYLTKPVREETLYRSIITTADEQDAARQTTKGHAENSVKQSAPHVLVAEDNPINQEVARHMLEDLGCRVDMAANGQETLDAYGHKRYKLIFMDCQMPDLDGFEATRRIRRLEAENLHTRTPIIAITANAFKEDRDQCLQAGMDDYLSKPFNQEQLKMMLERWLSDGTDQYNSHTRPQQAFE